MKLIAKNRERVSALVHHFVKLVPRAGRTKIVKFLYLSDLYSRKFLGHPITDLEYIWHDYGPFDSGIYAKISELVDCRAIKEQKVQYPKSDGFEYLSLKTPTPLPLSEDEIAIVKYVAERFGSMALEPILRRVYKTD